MSALKRLSSVLSSLTGASESDKSSSSAILGHLNLGGVSLPVYETNDPDRLPRDELLLDHRDPRVSHLIWWCLQKTILEQDIFLLGSPGPFARRLALTYCALLNKPFEYVALHRDVGEAELKQSREIRRNAHGSGTTLEYVDSAAVRAVKNGSILILDGIEKTERGVLPLLNNLLENREVNLESGEHIVSRDRYELMQRNGEDTTNFIPAHKDFRVIAIGVPVPPYSGYPLDPPFRSRFQVRYLDPLATGQILADQQAKSKDESVSKLAEAVSTVQITREMRNKMASGVSLADEVPNFPQTSLSKWARLVELFPPPHPDVMTPSQFANALLSIHPMLSYASPANWRAVESALESAGFGQEVAEMSQCDPTDVAQEGAGIFGWQLTKIERVNETTARVHFDRGGIESVTHDVPCGPFPFATYPLKSADGFLHTPRFQYQLTALVQLHALGTFDIAVLPPSSSLQSSSSSTTILISTFAALFGYGEPETIHLYKEIGGRELWMRRVVHTGEDGQPRGTTSWEPAPLIQSAWKGKLVHLEGVDTIGATAGSLARLFNDREGELWEGKRLGGTSIDASGPAKDGNVLSFAHPSFRVIVTSSKATPPKEWLTEEIAAMFVSLPTIAMPLDEERVILLATGCPEHLVDTLETFARAYRRANSAPGSKTRRLGTAALVRVAKRLARFPDESLHTLLNRTLLSEFLPATTKSEFSALLADCNIQEPPSWHHPAPEVRDSALVFPAVSDLDGKAKPYSVPLFDTKQDPMGASHVPFMNIFLDNSQQTALMRDIATDLEVLNEHVLLLGAQGVGKNKIIDRLLMLLKRPREYVQLHRDSTVQSLQYQTVLDGGVIRYVDSPMLRAIQLGRVLMIDEVDKAAAPVVASLASLAARGEMTLSDGRKVRPPGQRSEPGDVVVHPNFRLVLLANRPGFPFLGNPFLRVLGDTFSTYAVVNPDADSELRLLTQLAPELGETLLRRLVHAFADLRAAFDAGTLSYPFSLRELLAIVRHIRRFPDDSLEQVLRNVFDFDISRPETLDALYAILKKHKLGVEKIGIDAVRDADKLETKTGKVIDFEPQGDQKLDDPKYGKTDNKQHKGGNTWAGGTGGRSTAGLGGRGGYMRLYKGGDIHQVSEAMKADVPDDIKKKARDMARKALAERLAEIDMTTAQASAYSSFHDAVQSHVHQLVSFLDNLEANEDERVWLKRQSDGELDEHRLTEGLTGEASIYKRRGLDKPELGKPQIKPKRIRFIFDLSASMYRNQYDQRLTRSLEAATMILESFSRLQRKEKYRIDLVGQSGEEAVIPLVATDALPTNAGDRYKVLQKMAVVPQYAWAGDHTIEAIEKGIATVAETDSDDYFVIAITDANFHRYGITAEEIKRAMESNAKVKCSLIAIGEGAETTWLPQVLPGKAYRVVNTGDIATTLRAVLGTFLSSGL